MNAKAHYVFSLQQCLREANKDRAHWSGYADAKHLCMAMTSYDDTQQTSESCLSGAQVFLDTLLRMFIQVLWIVNHPFDSRVCLRYMPNMSRSFTTLMLKLWFFGVAGIQTFVFLKMCKMRVYDRK